MSTTPTLAALQEETLAVLGRLIARGSRVALIDFPLHTNSGDLVIAEGTLNYLEQLGVEVGYLSSTFNYDREALRRLVPEGPILCQGGGNFGDRWPTHQHLRERVIADFPDRHIIQLPQSIEWIKEAALGRAQRLYSQHRSLTLLARDTHSLTETARLFPSNPVALCPDLALGVGRVESPATAERDLIVLKRRDSEAHAEFAGVPAHLGSATTTDWRIGRRRGWAWATLTLAAVTLHAARPVRPRLARYQAAMFRRQSQLVVRSAVEQIGQGSVVVTDRLHAGVLGLLMGKPVVFVDNENHKVSLAYHEYLHRFPQSYLAESFPHAFDQAQELLRAR